MVGPRVPVLLIALVAALALGSTACTKRSGGAQTSGEQKFDARSGDVVQAVAAGLQQMGYGVQITEANEVKTEIPVGDGRTHLVWLGPEFSVLGRPYREIYAFGCDFSEPLYAGNVLSLATNDGTKCFLGGWGVQPLGPEGGDRCVFTATIPANTPIQSITDLMHCAAYEGDRLEGLIVDGDRL